jgi:hypothetical protein
MAIILLSGCMGSAQRPETGLRPWAEQLELEVGEPGVFDDGALVVTPIEIGDAHAVVRIERSNNSTEGRLTTDSGGFLTVPPYRVYLLSAETNRRAVIAVGRD